ncbi:MAG: HAMP domain-containing protein, partial [Clostridia bacterium]|nr:HAMP domain-containing protein [Clostridia bacterium]
MFRSLQMKLVLVLVMLVISVMAVVGIFLLNSIAARDTQDFLEQMNEVFTPEFILSLEKAASSGAEDVRDMMNAYSAQMGIDKNRMFFVLDGVSGEYLAGSDEPWGASLRLTPNMIAALSGRVGQTSDRLSDSLDIALPLRDDSGKVLLVVGVTDNKTEINTLTWNILTMLIRAIFFALVVALLLSFLLSKTITTPVEKLTEQAASIASGDLSQRAEVSSTDEFGDLCETFNEMADTLEHTLREVGEERNKLDTIFRHMADGVVAFSSDGKLIHVNPAARDMLGKDITPDMSYAEVFPN